MGLKEDMVDWEWRAITMEDCPQSEFEELKAAIREAWKDPEKKTYWEMRIADEAEFSRELKAAGKAVCLRMKALQKAAS